ncbi:sensor histidine kinase [Francisella sp. W12-1067]|nr:sensor histidine kinase [Francisella sp. W12-1067]
MSSKNNLNKTIQRKYIISSSFKMAMLFTILLSLSIISWIYVVVSSISGDKISQHVIPLVTGLSTAASVVIISYFVSIFVVRKINHIATTAASIINTQDFSCRIESKANWDDLSNLANILNILFENIENLLTDIKNVSNNIAHDLKTPLTRLKNKLEILEEKYPDQDTEKALEECDKLLEVFNSLLRLNRLEHGHEKIIKNYLNIKNLIRDAIELYEPIFEQKNITVKTDITAKPLNLDKNLFFQSIINILDNCYKYSDKNTSVTILGTITKTNYKLTISDTGAGVANQNFEKIFERFFREEQSRTQQGNGLGLALVKKVIELHNGNITAKNNLPTGLLITITIPLH